MSETKLQSRIVDMLTRMGVWVFRINSGVSHGAGGCVQGAPPGTPDLCLPALGWLEVKVPGVKLSPSQVKWHARARKEDVRVDVVHSCEEAAEVVCRWLAAEGIRLNPRS